MVVTGSGGNYFGGNGGNGGNRASDHHTPAGMPPSRRRDIGSSSVEISSSNRARYSDGCEQHSRRAQRHA